MASRLAADLRRRRHRLGRRPRHLGRVEQVFVAVYDVTDDDVAALDQWEAADIGLYRKTRVRVSLLSGEEVAWLYVLDAYEGGLPSANYLSVLADAAEAGDAPSDYVAGLRRRECRSNG